MRDQKIDFILENLCFQGAEWDAAGTIVERDRLNPAAKLWMHFLKQNLMPTSHTATVNLPRLQLFHSILNARSINLGQLIFDEAFADFFIRGRQGIKPSQIPSLMGFDDDSKVRAPPSGARTIAEARMAELIDMVENSQAQLNHMHDKLTSLFQYMCERDEAIQSYFLEMLPNGVPLFPIFPRDLFQLAHPHIPDERATTQVPPAPAQGLKTPTYVPKSASKAPSFTRLTLTRKGKTSAKPNPSTPIPEAIIELDNADDDEKMPDAPQPPAPTVDTSIPHRRLKRKVNRNISMADLVAEDDAASDEEEDNGSSTTP
uniref:Putative plant transposon protein domain-containing protein n=1 Tax=Hibiscus sabdariffa TaxID=183260 RepID=A0ABR2F8J6_9ROSI